MYSKLSAEEQEDFKVKTRELVLWLRKNSYPYGKIVIKLDSVELSETDCFVPHNDLEGID